MSSKNKSGELVIAPQRNADFSSERLAATLYEEIELSIDSRFAIAYSGGCDSQALLHAMSVLRHRYSIDLIALHFDHGLSEYSKLWCEQCEQWCAEFNVPFLSHREMIIARTGESLEALARNARYAWFERITDKNRVVLTAHHFDDQIETILLNLIKGRSVESLTGIAKSRTLSYGKRQLLVRPLLQISKEKLKKYNEENGLNWITDPSNKDDIFDRNYLRNQIMPKVQSRWPNASKGVGRISQKLQRVSSVYQQHIKVLYQKSIQDSQKRLFCLVEPISIEALSHLGKWDYIEVIRLWIHQSGNRSPSDALLEETYRQIVGHHAGAGGFEYHSYEVKNFANRLHLMHKVGAGYDESISIHFDLREKQLVKLGIRLGVEREIGHGLNVEKMSNRVIQLTWRKGGERVVLPGRNFRHSLKKLHQKCQTPPWERDRLPFVTVDGEAVWVSGIGVLGDYRCGEQDEGLSLQFKRLDD
ncbi:MAG: tRNA lysidine(34) synthetase TilS [Gammaproteobacteria bacterium]|nr:tRNA lysidine(34) synthetase TilS [Gammaproteobacteria bacterium]